MKNRISYLLVLLLTTMSLNGFAQDTSWMAPMSRQNDLKGPVATVETRTYAGIGNSPGAIESVEKREYDERGNLLRVREYSLEGKLLEEEQNTFDDQGNWTAHREQDEDGAVEEKITVDPQKREITKTRKDGSRDVTQYDDTGFEIHALKYDGQGNLSEEWELVRNSNHKETSVKVIRDGKTDVEMAMDWTPEGHIARQEMTLDKDSKVTLTYDYKSFDDHGNWTERIERENFQIAPGKVKREESLQIQEITYH